MGFFFFGGIFISHFSRREWKVGNMLQMCKGNSIGAFVDSKRNERSVKGLDVEGLEFLFFLRHRLINISGMF